MVLNCMKCGNHVFLWGSNNIVMCFCKVILKNYRMIILKQRELLRKEKLEKEHTHALPIFIYWFIFKKINKMLKIILFPRRHYFKMQVRVSIQGTNCNISLWIYFYSNIILWASVVPLVQFKYYTLNHSFSNWKLLDEFSNVFPHFWLAARCFSSLFPNSTNLPTSMPLWVSFLLRLAFITFLCVLWLLFLF